MLTVATVLRSGGEYRPEHVLRLAEQVHENLTLPHWFACLTDQPYDVAALSHGIEPIDLLEGWPGWFAKLALFKPGRLPLPVFYLDLDTTIVANIDDLVIGHQFAILRNFWNDTRFGSAVMAWDCDLKEIYQFFAFDPKSAMQKYSTGLNLGDQAFIRYVTPIAPVFFQESHPGRVVSYRRHCLAGVPPGASIVCYGGKCRPWNTPPLKFVEQ